MRRSKTTWAYIKLNTSLLAFRPNIIQLSSLKQYTLPHFPLHPYNWYPSSRLKSNISLKEHAKTWLQHFFLIIPHLSPADDKSRLIFPTTSLED